MAEKSERMVPFPVRFHEPIYVALQEISSDEGIAINWIVNKAVKEFLIGIDKLDKNGKRKTNK